MLSRNFIFTPFSLSLRNFPSILHRIEAKMVEKQRKKCTKPKIQTTCTVYCVSLIVADMWGKCGVRKMLNNNVMCNTQQHY